MAIDVEAEDLVPFKSAADAFPKGANRPCKQTLHRWRKAPGIRGKVLETVVIGGIRYTSREAIVRFCADDSTQQKAAATPSQRRRKTTSAVKALAGMGIG